MSDMQRSIRFPADLDAEIQRMAVAEDRSFSYVVIRMLEAQVVLRGMPSPFVSSTADPEPERVIAVERPVLKPGACVDCGRFNGVHRGDCPRHPRNA